MAHRLRPSDGRSARRSSTGPRDNLPDPSRSPDPPGHGTLLMSTTCGWSRLRKVGFPAGFGVNAAPSLTTPSGDLSPSRLALVAEVRQLRELLEREYAL